MTLKTNNGKTAYLVITIIVIVTTLILSIIYINNTLMREAILARDSKGEVYIVDPRNSCGECEHDIWDFYSDDGSVKNVSTPLQRDYNFIKVYFNRNHYNNKTKTFTFGSYSETLNIVFSKDFYMTSKTNMNGFKVYKELDSGYEWIRWFSLLFWVILSGFFISLPLIHIRPSKKFFAELMKYASYADGRIVFHFKDDELRVDICGTCEDICFSEVYYKGDEVACNVYVLLDGTLENAGTYEYYWIKRATKSILPAFKNKMVDSKIEHIL